MEEKLINTLIDEILLDYNEKINDKCSFKEFLESLNIERLTLSSVIYVYNVDDYNKLLEIKNMANMDKKYAINFVLENLEDIVKAYMKILPDIYIKQLKKVSSSDGIISFDMYEKGYNLQFLGILKNSILSKVYYDKNDEYVYIHMPNEIKNIIRSALKDKNLIRENKKNNKIYELTSCCVNSYGILTLEELYILFVKFKQKIHFDELYNILNNYMFIDDAFRIAQNDDNILVVNMEFETDEEAFKFYENSTGELNFNLSLEDLKNISDDQYIYNLKSYKKLMNYLDKEYDNIKEDSEFFDSLVVIDYVYSAQISIETAKKNFKSKIHDILEIDRHGIKKIEKMLEDIFLEYPKWSKRGNI